MIKLKLHSIVDVITNSSTVIYTYQSGCVAPAKELINEMLKLSGETDKKAEDIFYFGVFCDDEEYYNYLDENDEQKPEDYPEVDWRSPDRGEQQKVRQEWFDNLVLKIMKGEIEQPRWMEKAEEANGWSDWAPSNYLVLVPREERYKDFGEKIKTLLNAVDADGGREG